MTRVEAAALLAAHQVYLATATPEENYQYECVRNNPLGSEGRRTRLAQVKIDRWESAGRIIP